MVDFLLTPTGDLVFTEIEEEKTRLKLSFFKSAGKALKINFNVEDSEYPTRNNNTLVINFNLENIKNNKRILTVKDNAYLMQQIIIRFKTSLGELPLRSTYGSLLETTMHKNLHDIETRKDIEKKATDAIADLLDDFYVKATPIINRVNGYNQTMCLTVYENDEEILRYEME